MMTLELKINEKDRLFYGLKGPSIDFEVLRRKIIAALVRDRLDKSLEIAKANGISEMTMEEINEEIAQYRKEKRASLSH